MTPGLHAKLGLKVMSDFYSASGQPKATLAMAVPSGKIQKNQEKGYELELVINVEDSKGQIRSRLHKIYSSKKDHSGEYFILLEDISVLQEPYAIYLALRDNVTGHRSTWMKTIYPKPHHLKKNRATPPGNPSYNDVSKWENKVVDNGVEAIK